MGPIIHHIGCAGPEIKLGPGETLDDYEPVTRKDIKQLYTKLDKVVKIVTELIRVMRSAKVIALAILLARTVYAGSATALAPQAMCFAPMVASDEGDDEDLGNDPPYRQHEAFFNRRVGIFQMLTSFAHKWAGNGNKDRVLVIGDEPVLTDFIHDAGIEAYGLYWLPVDSPRFVQALRIKMPFKPHIFRVVFSMMPLANSYTVAMHMVHEADWVLRQGGFYVTDLFNEHLEGLFVLRGYQKLPYTFKDEEGEYFIFQKQRSGHHLTWEKVPIYYGNLQRKFGAAA